MSDATTLAPLDATTVTRPDLPVTILQFGGGRFLRAFVDQMVQAANDAGAMHDGVAIVHPTDVPDLPTSALRRQDGLYHVVLEGVRDGRAVREVTRVECVQVIVRAHGEFERYRRLYLSPELRVIVSNTTEAGIVWVQGDDLRARPPASFPAKVAALLHDRYEHFGGDPAAGLAVVCCELIEDNATTLRRYVLRHAADAGLGDGFASWVRTACTFHDSLVDRIVPGFPRDEIEEIQAELGFADQDVVVGELYAQWVIGGDPVIRDLLPLDRAGLPVEFMPDVTPYRTTKVRILNGQHTALAPLGLLLGCSTVREVMERSDVSGWLRRLLDTEILPSVDGPADEVRAFADRITERLGNPFLSHNLTDIMLNAVAKWGARSLPVLLDAIERGDRAPLTALAFAATLAVQGEQGTPLGFVPRDDAAALTAVRQGFSSHDLQEMVRRVIVDAALLPGDDPRLPAVVAEVGGQLETLRTVGVEAAMAASAA